MQIKSNITIVILTILSIPAYAAEVQSPDMTIPVMAGVFILFLIMAVSGGKKKPAKKKKKATKRKAAKKLTAKQKKKLLKELMS